MNLQQALTRIAKDFQLDADKLQKFAAEDEYTGWDNGEGQFPIGSLWQVEGQVLYALIRATEPKTLMEIGTHYGASTTHIAAALDKNRLTAKVTSIDKREDAGSMIPKVLQRRVEIKNADGINVLKRAKNNSIDFIYEDSDHSYETCQQVAELAQKKLKPGGFLVVHDAKHFLVGQDIRNGLLAGHIVPEFYLIAPSDCGLAIWQKPPVETVVEEEKPVKTVKPVKAVKKKDSAE